MLNLYLNSINFDEWDEDVSVDDMRKDAAPSVPTKKEIEDFVEYVGYELWDKNLRSKDFATKQFSAEFDKALEAALDAHYKNNQQMLEYVQSSEADGGAWEYIWEKVRPGVEKWIKEEE
jgi:hypothetical protein